MFAVTITRKNTIDEIRGFETSEDAEACFRNVCHYRGVAVEDLDRLLDDGRADLRDGLSVYINAVTLDSEHA